MHSSPKLSITPKSYCPLYDHAVFTNKVQLTEILCHQLLSSQVWFCQQHIQASTCNYRKWPGHTCTGQRGQALILWWLQDISWREAGVKIVPQMVNLATNGEALIKVIFDDTDVFLLLIHHYFHIDLKCAVLMEGTAANRVICNTRDQNTKHLVTFLGCSCPYWILLPTCGT